MTISRFVGTAVFERAREGVDVVGPHPFDAMQGAASRAEEEIVEGREAGIVLGIGPVVVSEGVVHGITLLNVEE